jgi:hypothetical protein
VAAPDAPVIPADKTSTKGLKGKIPSHVLLQEFDIPSCKALARAFIDGPANALLKKDAISSPTQTEDLAKVIERHRAKLQIHGYQDLRGRLFSHDTKEVKTHRSQSVFSTLSKNYAVINMVMQPSVVASWNEDGQNREKVWGRAVILWSSKHL